MRVIPCVGERGSFITEGSGSSSCTSTREHCGDSPTCTEDTESHFVIDQCKTQWKLSEVMSVRIIPTSIGVLGIPTEGERGSITFDRWRFRSGRDGVTCCILESVAPILQKLQTKITDLRGEIFT